METKGISIRLRDASPELADLVSTQVISGEALTQAEVDTLFAGMEELKAAEVSAFHVHSATLPKALVESVIQPVFDPVESTRPLEISPELLTVDHVSPSGDSTPVHQVLVVFSRPVVRLGEDLDSLGITLNPPALGRWRWVDTYSIAFEPKEQLLAGSTTYTVTIPELTSFDGHVLQNPKTFAFSTPRLKIMEAPSGTKTPGTRPTMTIRFDQVVDSVRLLASLKSDVAVEISDELDARTKDWRDGTWLTFRPAAPLPAGRKIKLEIPKGATCGAGPLPLVEALRFEFETAGAFAVEKIEGSGAPPGYAWTVLFNNSVDFNSFKNSEIEVEPPFPIQVGGWENRLTVSGQRDPKTAYTLTFPEGVMDVHGQPLTGKRTFKIATGNAEPELRSMGGSLVTIPTGTETTLAVQSLEYRRLSMSVYAVDPTSFETFRHDYSGIAWHGATPSGEFLVEESIDVTTPAKWTETPLLLTAHFQKSQHLIVVVKPKLGAIEHVKNAVMGSRIPAVVHWVQRTGLGVTALVDDSNAHLLVTTLCDGAPVRDAKVSSGAIATHSDQKGMAWFGLVSSGDAILVEKGEDQCIAEPSTYLNSRGAEAPRFHIFSDRGLYKPGETAHVKGWMRTVDGDGLLGFPGISSVIVSARDAHWNEIWQGTLSLSAAGDFGFKLPISETTTPGDLHLQFTHPLGNASFSLQVQEFRRPEFEVSTSVSERCFVDGEEFRVGAKAAYYTGEALGSSELKWSVRAETGEGFVPPGWAGFEFGRSRWRPWFFRSQPSATELAVETREVRTDADGAHTLGVVVAGLEPDESIRVTAEALAFDVQRQAFAGRSTVWVHPSSDFLGLKLEKAFFGKDQEVAGEVIVVDDMGRPVVGRQLDVHLEAPDADGVAQIIKSANLLSAAEPVRFSIKPPQGGSYALVLRSADSKGRLAKTFRAVWVAGEIRTDTRIGVEKLEVVAQKEDWLVGDRAAVLLVPPFAAGSGIATLEYAGKIRKTFTFEFDGTHTLEFDVVAGMIPGATFHACVVGARQGIAAAASGELELKVDRAAWRLNTSVVAAEPEVKPGGETLVSVHVKLPDGSPAVGAQVTLWAVDESVLALAGYTTPDPLALYSRIWAHVRPHESRTTIPNAFEEPGNDVPADLESDSMAFSMPPEALSFGAGGLMPPSPKAPAPQLSRSAKSRSEGGGGGGPPTGAPVYIRNDFSALAAFFEVLEADQDGVVRAPVKVPDNLTRYRLMANVSWGAGHFGAADAALVARQALMIRPTKPRFLNMGDQAEFPIVIQNALAEPTTVWLGFRATNLDVHEAGYKVELGPKERREIRFPVSSLRPGRAEFQVVGRTNEDADAAQDGFDILTPASAEAVGVSGEMEAGGMRQDIALPSAVYAEFGGLDVRLSTTLLSGLTDLLVDVIRYPFRCAEQLASRLMTVALLHDFLPAFKGDQVPSAGDMRDAATDDLSELVNLQQPNGGWGFWFSGRTYPVVTIHVVHALIEAKKAGFDVDDKMLSRGLGYLDAIERHLLLWTISKKAKRNLILHAAWVRSRAGLDEVKRAHSIYKKDGDDLSVDALGWLLSIFSRAKAAEASQVFEALQNRLSYDGGKAQYVETVAEEDKHVLLCSSRRSNAIVLDALIDHQEANPNIGGLPTAKIVQGLLAHRWKGNTTTQENAFVLLGLMRYFHAFEKHTPSLDISVFANHFLMAEHHFEGRQTDILQNQIPMEWLQENDPISLGISTEGAGRLYWRATMKWAPKDFCLKAEDRGFFVDRVFEAVDDAADISRAEDGTWLVRAGARIKVRTTVVARKPRHHVALVSPIPAGFELLNPEFATTEQLPDESSRGHGHDIWALDGPRGPFFMYDFWWRRWFDHQVLRDDRAEAFAASLWPGVHEHVVFARATMPGEFIVPSARAEEMYEPEVWGRSESTRVVVSGE